MPLEAWNTVLQVASVVLLAFTFAVGAAALLVSRSLAQRQNSHIAGIEKKAGEAHERAAKLEVEAANARIKLAEAETRLVELKNSIADRMVALTNVSVKRLGKFAGVKYSAQIEEGDTEAARLFNDIGNVLASSGWKNESASSVYRLMPGVVIRARGKAGAQAGEELALYLLANRIEAKFMPLFDAGPDTEVKVMVGRKPPVNDFSEFIDKEQQATIERIKNERAALMERLRKEWFPHLNSN